MQTPKYLHTYICNTYTNTVYLLSLHDDDNHVKMLDMCLLTEHNETYYNINDINDAELAEHIEYESTQYDIRTTHNNS